VEDYWGYSLQTLVSQTGRGGDVVSSDDGVDRGCDVAFSSDDSRLPDNYYEARFSSDGQWLVDLPDLGGGKKTIEVIQLWDTTTGELSGRLEFELSPSNVRFPARTRSSLWSFPPIAISLPQSTTSRSSHTHSLSCTLSSSHTSISCVTFSPPEIRLLAYSNNDSTIQGDLRSAERPSLSERSEGLA